MTNGNKGSLLIKYTEFIATENYSNEKIRLTDWNSRTEINVIYLSIFNLFHHCYDRSVFLLHSRIIQVTFICL